MLILIGRDWPLHGIVIRNIRHSSGGAKCKERSLGVIKFVSDMTKAVTFYRDVLDLRLKFESPGWSEFVTGETTLALHPASEKNPAGKVELGFTVGDVEAFYRDMSARGVVFSMPPKKQDFGGVLAQFIDSEGAHCSVAAEAA